MKNLDEKLLIIKLKNYFFIYDLESLKFNFLNIKIL